MKSEKQIKDLLDHYDTVKENHYSGSFWIKQQVEAYTFGLVHALEWVLEQEGDKNKE